MNMLRQAQHLRNMREDVMRPADLKKLAEAQGEVRAALSGHDLSAVETASNNLCACLNRLSPTRSYASFRENLEILVVAVAVAMAFRTYFIQPFKIPTGSMEPTLYGIHSAARLNPAVMDTMPLKLVKWLVVGEWYREITVGKPGQLEGPVAAGMDDPAICYYYVAGRRYSVPRDAMPNFRPGEYVKKGDVLCSVVVTTGDHVFVDKVSWNFRRPRRGEVMVFSTDNIHDLPPDTHYIKRMTGLPGETISVTPPNLLVNGKIIMEPRSIARIARMEPPYQGYQTIGQSMPGYLRTSSDKVALQNDQYFALGDNTTNSRDGRYWGAVPEKNLVGPAVFVYWPISRRWGVIHN